MTTKFSKRLDKSRPFGEVHPAGTNGVFFEQDGFPFDHDGRLVESQLTDAHKEELKKPPAERKQQPAPAPALTAEQIEALKAAGLLSPEQEAALAKPQKSAADGDGSNGKGGDTDLNLELWLKGEAEYDFRDVQKAVKDRYSVWNTKKNDLVQFLVQDPKGPMLVPAAQVGAALKPLLDGSKA